MHSSHPHFLDDAAWLWTDFPCALQVLYYCHFPDQLLAKRRSRLHAAYRVLMDAIEESSTGQAHQILVNSSFTQGRALYSASSLLLPRPAVSICTP